MIGTTRVAKPTVTGPELKQVDTHRFAVLVNGYVRFAGSLEACQKRMTILTAPQDRVAQDHALGRMRL